MGFFTHSHHTPLCHTPSHTTHLLIQRNDDKLDTHRMVRMARGVAMGMDYLATVGYVHRVSVSTTLIHPPPLLSSSLSSSLSSHPFPFAATPSILSPALKISTLIKVYPLYTHTHMHITSPSFTHTSPPSPLLFTPRILQLEMFLCLNKKCVKWLTLVSLGKLSMMSMT